MFLGSRARLVREADNLTAICEPIASTICDPQQVCYEDSFAYFTYHEVC
jgi:hypothetical protein